ncbi:ketoacyl-ACP synthase III family protein [Streptomyces sp. NBC_01304]|uniref:ketoacyl-ACP synthase III family protein n=1 Tax=Streptomyces sp. NBC_01304 TaxID=2903818 RepID=UPI002E12F604|nr:ketoacyl-ACP synthase III family protein [Streptomyces sp. NBC_01304]
MRLGDALSIKAVSTWLPAARETVAEAIAGGRLEPEHRDRVGVTELPVSHDLAGPQLAARAGRQALESASWDADRVGLLSHSWIYHQGHDFWAPAHYVAHQVGLRRALPFGLQHMSNGAALGMQLAAVRLLADPDMDSVMVTTGDRFAPPGYDRWAGDYDVVYGDGGTALVLGRRDGDGDLLHMLSFATAAAPETENFFRGRDEFSAAPLTHSTPIDVRRPKKAFLEMGGMETLKTLGLAKVRQVLQDSLRFAGVEATDPRIRCIALPRAGDSVYDLMYLPVIEDVIKAEPLFLGRRTGHLGSGDFIANLTDIVGSGILEPGEIALVIGGGAGYTWSSAVFQAPEKTHG